MTMGPKQFCCIAFGMGVALVGVGLPNALMTGLFPLVLFNVFGSFWFFYVACVYAFEWGEETAKEDAK